MISPLKMGPWVEFDTLLSTQDYAIQCLRESSVPVPGVVFAYHQSQGRGRLKRKWESEHYTSLSMTLIFSSYAHHDAPWFIGMSVAIAAAEVLELQLQWPNDLTFKQQKIGGVLTEIIKGIPLVGIGMNLNQTEFNGDYRRTPSSIYLACGKFMDPKQVALQILSKLDNLPEPRSWKEIELLWNKYDDTSNKIYLSSNGERFKAKGIGSQGELIIELETGEKRLAVAEYLEKG